MLYQSFGLRVLQIPVYESCSCTSRLKYVLCAICMFVLEITDEGKRYVSYNSSSNLTVQSCCRRK